MHSVPSLGFQKVVTMEQLREQHPLLDMMDHSRKTRVQVRTRVTPRTSSSHLLILTSCQKVSDRDLSCLICSTVVIFTLNSEKR